MESDFKQLKINWEYIIYYKIENNILDIRNFQVSKFYSINHVRNSIVYQNIYVCVSYYKKIKDTSQGNKLCIYNVNENLLGSCEV